MRLELEQLPRGELEFPPQLNEMIQLVAEAGQMADANVVLKGGAVRDLVWNFYHGTAFVPNDLDFFVDRNLIKLHGELLKKGAQLVERRTRKGTPVFKYKLPLTDPDFEIEVGYLIDKAENYDKQRLWNGILKGDAECTDLMVNSLSVKIVPNHSRWSLSEVQDPLGAIVDIQQKEIRLAAPTALFRTPDSILRTIRIAYQLGARLPYETLAALYSARNQIARVPFHLLQCEARKIIDMPNYKDIVETLSSTGIIDALFPGRTINALDLFSYWFTNPQFTVIIMKPDGIQKGLSAEVINGLESKKLVLAARKTITLSSKQVVQLYPDIRNKWLIPKMIDYLTSGDCEALLFLGGEAIKKGREVVGSTALQTRQASGIRGKYADDFLRNVAHAPDSKEELKRTVTVVWPELPLPK